MCSAGCFLKALHCSQWCDCALQEPQADAKRLPTIVDEQGAAVSLAACMAQERTSICQVEQHSLSHE